MAPPPRNRRRSQRLLIARWVLRFGVFSTAGLAACLALSFRFGVYRGQWRAGEDAVVGVERGALTGERWRPSLMIMGGEVRWAAYNAASLRVLGRDFPPEVRRVLGLLPVALSRTPGRQPSSGWSFPLWIPLAGSAGATWLARRWLRRTLVRGVCPACGYQLEGLRPAVPCPECGELLG